MRDRGSAQASTAPAGAPNALHAGAASGPVRSGCPIGRVPDGLYTRLGHPTSDVARVAFLAALIAVAVPAGAQSRLAVTVINDSTGQIIAGATVLAANGGAEVSAGADGVAMLSLPPGIHIVSVSADGYDRATFTVTLDDEETAGTVGLLPSSVALDEVTVTAQGARRDLDRTGFLQRREGGAGYYIDRDELDLKGQGQLINALRGVPGIYVQGYGTYFGIVSSRWGMSPDGMRSNAPCPITMFKDGFRVDVPDVAQVGTEDLAGIEVYAGPATIPVEFRQFSACGVVLLWSRQE